MIDAAVAALARDAGGADGDGRPPRRARRPGRPEPREGRARPAPASRSTSRARRSRTGATAPTPSCGSTSASTPTGASSCAQFVALSPTPLERAEPLEQLRALEHGHRIRAAVVEGWRSVPVDVPADVARVEAILAARTLTGCRTRGRLPSPEPERRSLPALAAALFFLSGAGALVVETLWLRWLRALLGATAPGRLRDARRVLPRPGAAAPRLAARLRRRAPRPLALYGALELAAAAWALAVPTLLRVGESALLPALRRRARASPRSSPALRFAAALAATLPASAAFGATLPALAAAVVGAPAALGRRGAALYGANVLGAAARHRARVVLASGRARRPGGVRRRRGGARGRGRDGARSSRGGSARSRARRPRSRRASRAVAQAKRASGRRAAESGGARLAALAALSGFATFAAEILLLQSFALVLDQSVYAFGAVLCVVLLALGAAALAVAALLARGVDPRALLAVGLGGGGARASSRFPPRSSRRPDGLALLAQRTAVAGLPARVARHRARDRRAGAPRRGARASPRRSAPRGCAAATPAPRRASAGSPPRTPPARSPARSPRPGCSSRSSASGPRSRRSPRSTRRRARARAGRAARARRARDASRCRRGGPRARCGAVAGAARGARARRDAAARSSRPRPGQVAVVESAGDLRIQIDNHYALGGSARRSTRSARRTCRCCSTRARGASRGSARRPASAPARRSLHPSSGSRSSSSCRAWRARRARWFGAVEPRACTPTRAASVVLDDGRNFVRATAGALRRRRRRPLRAVAGGRGRRSTRASTSRRCAHGSLRTAPSASGCPLYQLSDAELRIVLATYLDVFPDAALFRGDFYGRFPIVALVGYAGRAPDAAAIGDGGRRPRARRRRGPLGDAPDRLLEPLRRAARPARGGARRRAAQHGRPARPRVPRRAEPRGRRARAGRRLHRRALRDVRAGGRGAGSPQQDARFGALGAERLRAAAGGHALQSADALFAAGRARRERARRSPPPPRSSRASSWRTPRPDPSVWSAVWRDD